MSDTVDELRRYTGGDNAQTRELVSLMHRAADELEQARAQRKQDCVDFFRWFWNAPGTNAEQGYDQWLRERSETTKDRPCDDPWHRYSQLNQDGGACPKCGSLVTRDPDSAERGHD